MARAFLLLSILCIAVSLKAQPKQPFPPASLQLEWQLIQNQYQGKSQTLSRLTLYNSGGKKIPGAGWSLYFNFVRSIDEKSAQAAGFDIEQLSGDWFRMRPRAGFAGIDAGKRVAVDWVSELWLLNRTDAPNGFYLVFDNEPEKGHSTGAFTILPPERPEVLLRSAEDKTPPATPERIYRQNEATTRLPAAGLQPVFPTPAYLQMQTGSFTLDGNTAIHADPAFAREAQLLAEDWPVLFGKKARLETSPDKHAPGIALRQTGDITEPEGYRMHITPGEGVVLSAATPAGMFYAIQSLKTMLPPQCWQSPAERVQLPCLLLRDQPRFAYRGLHVDVARNFQPASELRKLLDVMALYKLNKLHLHFSDDEGWRIEIPGLPELTGLGAFRGHATAETSFLHPALGSGPDPGKPSGSGFYTRQEYVELLRFATARHIEVIPEIELPGHARAAIKAMDARYERLLGEGQAEEAKRYLLRDQEDASEYRSVQWYNDNVVCVALPSVYAFVEKVSDELLAMYREAGAPLTSIHLGGDEVPAGVWEESPACRRLMETEGMPESSDLWYYFWRRMQGIMTRRGLQVSGWEEAGMRKTLLDGQPHYIPNPDFVNDRFRVYVWNNVLGWGAEDLAYRMANAGYEVVLGPVSNLYFDMAYQKDFDEPGYYWGAYTDVDKSFGFAPFDYFKTTTEDRFGNLIDTAIFLGKARLTDYGKSKIAGIEGLIWSETLHSPEDLEYMVFPKLLGLAERAWSPVPQWESNRYMPLVRQQYAEDWILFANRIGQRELPRLDHYAGGLQYRIPTPGAVIRDGMLYANIQLPGFTLRYTTDGSEPSLLSPAYTNPVQVGAATVHVRAFDTRGRGSRSVRVGGAR